MAFVVGEVLSSAETAGAALTTTHLPGGVESAAARTSVEKVNARNKLVRAACGRVAIVVVAAVARKVFG